MLPSKRAAADAELKEIREHARVDAAEEARAEFDGLRHETAQLFADLELRFGTVQSALTEAESVVRETLARLDQLRAAPGEGRASTLPSGESEAALERQPGVFVDADESADGSSEALEHRPTQLMAELGAEQRTGVRQGNKDSRPLGWLFRNQS